MKIEVAECCATCTRSQFMIIGEKKKNGKIYTGFSNPGKCFERGEKSVSIYHYCEKYEKRDDIFSAKKIKY